MLIRVVDQHVRSDMTPLYHRIYLAGYSGWVMPRRLRKLIARSELHRAWLAGFLGIFEDTAPHASPANT